MMEKKLKAYTWMPFRDCDTCVIVIAESWKEARKLGWQSWGKEVGNDSEYTECTCKLTSGDIAGLRKGAVWDYIEGLKRHLYSYAYNCECPRCKCEADYVKFDDGALCCSLCDTYFECKECKSFEADKEGELCEDCKRAEKDEKDK
jgi:hypothetical protein